MCLTSVLVLCCSGTLGKGTLRTYPSRRVPIATMAVVLPSGGSLLGSILFFLSILPIWLDDIIMTSLALTDAVLTSSELLAILVGVALIGLGGV